MQNIPEGFIFRQRAYAYSSDLDDHVKVMSTHACHAPGKCDCKALSVGNDYTLTVDYAISIFQKK